MIVLIVVRDASVNQNLQTALEELGVEWTLKICADATSALTFAQSSALDVVVSELRPVGMDGLALLERIRAKHPEAARIVLLEESEEAQAMKALASAHRILNKPLRAEELLEAVESIDELREILQSPELKQTVGRIDKLPPPPKLYLALTRAIDDVDVSPAQLAALIQQDPAITAKVLRLCNSAYYSGGRTISDVRTAVIRLGQQTLRRLVLATEVFSNTVNPNVDRDAMRDRALLSSQVAARLLAGSSSELAATAALLAEVGMLLPGVRYLDKNGQLVGEGPHYAEAGAYLLGMWGLPMPIVEGVAHHHQPQRSRSRGFWVAGAVHVARALVTGQPLDEEYLRKVSMLDRLPAWQKIAEDILERQEA